jgi:Flp pilus assembly protein TadG
MTRTNAPGESVGEAFQPRRPAHLDATPGPESSGDGPKGHAAPGRQRRLGERGQALVEFGLVAVIFFFFVFGILDTARLFESWMAVQHSAREAARYAITGRTDCEGSSGREPCIEWTAKNATRGLSRGGPDADDTDVSVTYQAWDYNVTGWLPASGSGTSGAVGKQCDQIQVTVTYTHKFITPLIGAVTPSGITLRGHQRMTNEPWGKCDAADGVS